MWLRNTGNPVFLDRVNADSVTAMGHIARPIKGHPMIPSAFTAGIRRSTCAAALATVATLILASSAAAVDDRPIFMDNCNSDNQSGDDCVYTTVVPNVDGIYVQFISSPDMCSSITARIGIGEPQPHYIGDDLVGPGQAGTKYFVPAEKPAGSSTVFVHAVGHTGGCNTGGLQEWAGTLHIVDRGYSLPGQ
jgi:hypothetical protein